MTRKWIVKPVNFDSTSPEEVELLRFAKSLPNFTVMVKGWLRVLKDGAPMERWRTSSYEMLSQPEIVPDDVEVNADQFC